MTNHNAPTCADLDRSLADYLAGVLPEAESVALEAHAASCTRCEARLEQATRRPLEHQLSMPAALRTVLREDTLRAVASARATSRASQPVRRPWVWAGGVSTLAAAAALAFILTRDTVSPGAPGEVVATTRDSAPIGEMRDLGGERIAASLADQEARSEFEALDEAAREIEAALAAAPSDRELRAYLLTVRARRDELSRRVKAATS